jgi:chitinase
MRNRGGSTSILCVRASRLLFTAILAAAGSPASAQAPASRPAIIGYVFPQERELSPSEIDAAKLTHINYAFANVKDGRLVEGFTHDAFNLRVLTGLRLVNPQLRILVSVGGWTWSKGFSEMALTPEARRRFCESAVAYVRRYDLDGVDVDWEYPGLPGDGNPHRPEDRENFTALMTELRAALDRTAAGSTRRLLLTFAAGAFPDFIAKTEMPKVQAVVDFVNLMTYDFGVPGDAERTRHNAALRAGTDDPDALSAERAVREFLAAGVPAGKLVLGVPFYGRAWEVEGEYGPLHAPGKRTAALADTDYQTLRALPGRDGWLRLWDDAAQAPWLWHPARRLFVSYEDPRSLRLKARLIRDHGLGGVMFWEYFADRSGELIGTLHDELKAKPR